MNDVSSAFDRCSVASLSAKFGIVMGESTQKDAKEAINKDLQAELNEMLCAFSGFAEVNKKHPEATIEGISGGETEEIFRFAGTFDMISHLLNLYGRRDWCVAANSPYLASTFGTIRDSQVLEKLAKQGQIGELSFMVLLKSLSLLPVKPKDAKGMFSDELAAVLRSGFDAIQPFYLQFDSMNQACTDALLNMLMMNYD